MTTTEISAVLFIIGFFVGWIFDEEIKDSFIAVKSFIKRLVGKQ